jgi:hypothetical protein
MPVFVVLEAVAVAPIPIIIRNRDRRALIFAFTERFFKHSSY